MKATFENLAEMAQQANNETERFLNQWINDRTKGWAIRSYPDSRSNRYSPGSLTIPNIEERRATQAGRYSKD
jgi:hypothetical protein